MLVRDIISEAVAPLQPLDDETEGLRGIENVRAARLPVEERGDMLGMVSDANIFDTDADGVSKRKYPPAHQGAFVYEYQHVYEAIELVLRFNLTALPVLAEDRKYLGVITVQQLIRAIGGITAASMSGGIIVLEMNANDYSLSQIAHIVEDNDAKVLSVYIAYTANNFRMEVTLKISRTDLTSIIQTFLRYGYTIKSYRSNNRTEEVLRNNYEQFRMYLNV